MCDEVRKIAYGIMNRFKGYLPKSAVVGNYEEYLRTFSKYPEILSGICPCDAESLFITGPCGEKLKVILYEYCKEKQNAIELRNELNEKNEELEKEIKELEFEIKAMNIADKYAEFLNGFERSEREELLGGGLRNNVDKAIQEIDEQQKKYNRLTAKKTDDTQKRDDFKNGAQSNIQTYVKAHLDIHSKFEQSYNAILQLNQHKDNFNGITRNIDPKYLFVVVMFFSKTLPLERNFIDFIEKNKEFKQNKDDKYKIQEEIFEAKKQENIMRKAIENFESELKRLNDIDIGGENCEKFRKAYGEKGMEKLAKMKIELQQKIIDANKNLNEENKKSAVQEAKKVANKDEFVSFAKKHPETKDYHTIMERFNTHPEHETHNALKEMYYSLRKFMEETEEIKEPEYRAFFLKDKPKPMKGGRFPKYRLTL